MHLATQSIRIETIWEIYNIHKKLVPIREATVLSTTYLYLKGILAELKIMKKSNVFL